MLHVLAGQRPLIAENRDIAKTAILLQVADAGDIGAQDLRHVVVALGGKQAVMVRVLDDDLVRSQASHLVVNAFRAPLRVALNPVEGTKMRNHSNLPVRMPVGVFIGGSRGESLLARAKGTGIGLRPATVAILLDHPALSYGVFPKLHEPSLEFRLVSVLPITQLSGRPRRGRLARRSRGSISNGNTAPTTSKHRGGIGTRSLKAFTADGGCGLVPELFNSLLRPKLRKGASTLG